MQRYVLKDLDLVVTWNKQICMEHMAAMLSINEYAFLNTLKLICFCCKLNAKFLKKILWLSRLLTN